MKIEGSGIVKAGNLRRSGRAASATAGDFGAHIRAGGEPAATTAVSGGAHLQSIEALLALQEAPAVEQGGGRATIQRGEDLLAGLEEIRDGILSGQLSVDGLQQLVRRLDERRQANVPARLAAVLDEIELRAKVELAKVGMI